MAFTIRQLQYFVAVAETGTVSGAAQQLSISQSSVTEAIKELEGDLGVALFDRHARGLSITHKGQQFLRHATRILTDVSDAKRTLADEPGAKAGKLSLGVTSLVAGYVLSDVLSRYRRAYPETQVSAIEDNGDLEPARPDGVAGGNPRNFAVSLVAAALAQALIGRFHRHGRHCRRAADHADCR